eukprot:TRINITY_DN61521_c0_g1_i1.p2 TRINITY_DN61521_c0_g1~~TRINITY_DN61521_c0_g1_i1.p2  ORF type:complete len:392 (-),score=23.93 TRINITY_DN61521_c0_g1_i1:1274-2449(-)
MASFSTSPAAASPSSFASFSSATSDWVAIDHRDAPQLFSVIPVDVIMELVIFLPAREFFVLSATCTRLRTMLGTHSQSYRTWKEFLRATASPPLLDAFVAKLTNKFAKQKEEQPEGILERFVLGFGGKASGTCACGADPMRDVQPIGTFLKEYDRRGCLRLRLLKLHIVGQHYNTDTVAYPSRWELQQMLQDKLPLTEVLWLITTIKEDNHHYQPLFFLDTSPWLAQINLSKLLHNNMGRLQELRVSALCLLTSNLQLPATPLRNLELLELQFGHSALGVASDLFAKLTHQILTNLTQDPLVNLQFFLFSLWSSSVGFGKAGWEKEFGDKTMLFRAAHSPQLWLGLAESQTERDRAIFLKACDLLECPKIQKGPAVVCIGEPAVPQAKKKP